MIAVGSMMVKKDKLPPGSFVLNKFVKNENNTCARLSVVIYCIH